MEEHKNKKIFYQYNEIFNKPKQKFGISFINENIFINRALSYQSLHENYIKFEGGILCSNENYNNIEKYFSKFIDKNKRYGIRLNKNRPNSEIYNIPEDDILKLFYKKYKKELDLEFLDSNQITTLNDNYKKYIMKNIDSEKMSDNLNEENKIKKIELRPYQLLTLQKWKDSNFKSGILNYHPGLGKTITALFMLYELFKHNGRKTLNVVWSTYYLDILYSQQSDFKILKDRLNLNIIDCVSTKSKKDIYLEIKKNKINIFLTNNDSLIIIENKYKKLNYTVFISDECKRITADVLYNFMNFCKSKDIKIIGLDGTPIKGNNSESIKRITEIFTEDYLIDEITYMEALKEKLCVPLKIKWVYIPKSKKRKDKISIQEYENILRYDDLYLEIYNGNKCISWASCIEESKNYHQALENIFKENDIEYENYISNSADDSKNIKMKLYLESKNNNANINCVDRFKEGTNDKNIFHGVQVSAINKQETHVFIQQTARLTRLAEGKDIATYYILVDADTEDEKKENLIRNFITYYNSNFTNHKINIKRDGYKIILSSINENTTPNEEYNCLEVCGLNELDFKEIYEKIHKISCKKLLKKKDFIALLKENSFTMENYCEMRQKHYLILDNRYDEYKKLYPDFYWSEVVSDKYYDKETIVIKIKNYVSKNKDKNGFKISSRDNKIRNISNDDKKIPFTYYLWYDAMTCNTIYNLLE